jgi:alpha-aminoadipate/glutamate carrier protein LysW
MSSEILCPECEGTLELNGVMVGEIVPCPQCGVELEVISLDPPQVELAPTEAEDWGE